MEANGLPTMVLGSAFDILQRAFAPRISFLDYPLGHQGGKPHDLEDQVRVVGEALKGFDRLTHAGQVQMIAADWGSSVDLCAEVGSKFIGQPRDDVLRYQTMEDMQKAVELHGKSAEGIASPEAQRQRDVLA